MTIDALARALLDGAPCIETIPGTEVGDSSINGRGLFARRAWSVGDVLGELDGQVVAVEHHPKIVAALEWNALTPELLLVRAIRTSYGFMNHDPNPNVSIDADGRRLRAARTIGPGDELTLDYFVQPVPPSYRASPEARTLLRGFGG